MPFRIEDKFEVKAPIDRVWSFLIDPQQVVQCLPGVKLTEIQDDKNFLGAMTLKIGPVSMSFQGKVQITEMDEAQHLVRMSGEGREGGVGPQRLQQRVGRIPRRARKSCVGRGPQRGQRPGAIAELRECSPQAVRDVMVAVRARQNPVDRAAQKEGDGEKYGKEDDQGEHVTRHVAFQDCDCQELFNRRKSCAREQERQIAPQMVPSLRCRKQLALK